MTPGPTTEQQRPAPISILSVPFLINAVMFTVGFQFSLTMAVSSSLIRRCLLDTFGAQYCNDHHGTYTSALLASSNLCNSLASPFWGRSADLFGRRPILLIGLFGAAISMIVFGSTHHILILFISRIVSGLLDSTMFMSKAIMGDVPDKSNRRFASMFTAFGVSQTVSPLAASFFDVESFGPCLFAGSTTAVVFVLVLLTLPETARRDPATKPPPWYRILMMKSTSGPLAIWTMLTMVLTSGEVVTVLVITDGRGGLGLPASSVGILLAIQGLGYIVTQLLICPMLTARYGAAFVFRVATMALVILYPCGIVPAWTTTSFACMALQMTLKVMASSTAITTCTILMNDSTEPLNRSSVMSIGHSGAGVARTMGLLVIGIIYDYAAVRAVLWLPFILLGVSIGFVSILSLALVSS